MFLTASVQREQAIAPHRDDTCKRPNRLRLTICAAGEIWGGVEQFITTLVTGLGRRHIHPTVVLFYAGPLAAALRDRGVAVEVLPPRHSHDPRLVSDLAAVLRRTRTKVIHAHGYKGVIAAALGIRASRDQRIKLIKTEHGRLEAPASIRGMLPFFRLGLNTAIDTVVTRAAVDRIVYVSRDTQRSRGRWCGAGEVIYNGIAPELLDGAPRRPSPQPFTVGIVGRLSGVKGHAFLFRALVELRDVRLKVFGIGPDEAALRALAARLNIADRVEFAGFVSPVLSAMASLDVLAIPSLHEGLPYTVLEAMSVGVPVVASRVGGLVEVIEDGVSGVLVAPKSPTALAAALRTLSSDPGWRAALAERARARVASVFHADRMIDSYIEAYERLVV